MPKESSDRIDLLQGTLDMLILKTLTRGPMHGYAVVEFIQQTSEDVPLDQRLCDRPQYRCRGDLC